MFHAGRGIYHKRENVVKHVVMMCTLFFLSLGWLLLPSETHAAIYVMVDTNGIYHFTNVPSNSKYSLYVPGTVTQTQGKKGGEYPTGTLGSPARYETLIQRYAAKFGVDPALIKAIIHAESRFNPYAVSKRGARGLMQLMPETARDLSVQDIFDPEENIRAGVAYFKKLLTKFKGNLRLSLAAYNAGPHLVAPGGKIPPYAETKNYIQKVLTYYRRYR